MIFNYLSFFNDINLLVFFTVGNFVVCDLRTLVAYIIYHTLISLSRWFISVKYVPLKPSGCFQYQRGWMLNNSTVCLRNAFLGFVWISEQTPIIFLQVLIGFYNRNIIGLLHDENWIFKFSFGKS
jgi:hypothetical protein